MSIILHPWENGVPSKTQEFDETLLLDLPRHRALATALAEHCRGRNPEELVFTVTATELTAALAEMEVKLCLDVLGLLHAYRLRHTGASHDFVSRERSLLEIQRRGRWRDPRSFRRYEKGGRVGELFARLPSHVQRHALECAAVVDSLLLGQLFPLSVPWLPQSS